MKNIAIIIAALLLLGCTKSKTTVPDPLPLNYDCKWTYNAYYILKKNGKTLVKSYDKTNTSLTPIAGQTYQTGDLIELYINSLDSLGVEDNSFVEATITVGGKTVSTKSGSGKTNTIYY